MILTMGNIPLGYALIPQVIKGFKDKKPHIAIQTGTITTIALFSITIVYFSLKLPFSGIMVSINTLLWLTLLIQSIIYQ
jgi:hypothetical protein